MIASACTVQRTRHKMRYFLHHCDMGPTNVLVDLSTGCKVGVFDWNRTKFGVCGAMYVGHTRFGKGETAEYIQQEGFPDMINAWRKMHSVSKEQVLNRVSRFRARSKLSQKEMNSRPRWLYVF